MKQPKTCRKGRKRAQIMTNLMLKKTGKHNKNFKYTSQRGFGVYTIPYKF